MKSTPEINTNTMNNYFNFHANHTSTKIKKKSGKKMYLSPFCAESIMSGSKDADWEGKTMQMKNWKIVVFYEWKYLRGGGSRGKAEWERERERVNKHNGREKDGEDL